MIRGNPTHSLVLAFLLAGCTCGGETAPSGGGGGGSATPPAAERRTIAVIPKGTTHVFWRSVHAGAQTAANALDVDIVWQGPVREDDRAGQIRVVEDMVTRGVEAIVLAPLDDTALVPAAKKWPLAELMAACRTYSEKTGRKIFYDWTLIEGKNDSADHARAVGRLLRGLPAQVNLIPLNPTSGYDGAPTRSDAAKRFQKTLADEFSLPSTVRQRRGIDIAAGCGQLAVAEKS